MRLVDGEGAMEGAYVFVVYDTVTYRDTAGHTFDVAETSGRALYSTDDVGLHLIMQAAAPLLAFLKAKHLHKNHPELLKEG